MGKGWALDDQTEQACREDARQVLTIGLPLFIGGMLIEVLSHSDGRLPMLWWWHVGTGSLALALLLLSRARLLAPSRPELGLLAVWAMLMASVAVHAWALHADAMGSTMLVLAISVIGSGALILPLVAGSIALAGGSVLFLVLSLVVSQGDVLKALPPLAAVAFLGISVFVARRRLVRRAVTYRELDRVIIENEARLAQARETSAMAARLSRGFAHHFRNQLQTIFSGVDGASMHVQGDHPAQQFLVNVGLAAQHAARMVSELVGYADERPLQASTFPAQPYFDELDLPAMAGPSVHLSVDVPDCQVYADPEQLGIALRELVSNALTAVAGREGRIQVTVTETARALDFLVTDNGGGVSAALPGDPTAPFVTSDEHARFGLGLAVVTAVATRHGGRFDILDSSARGTTVRLRLPPVSPAASQSLGAENVSQRR